MVPLILFYSAVLSVHGLFVLWVAETGRPSWMGTILTLPALLMILLGTGAWWTAVS